VDEGMKVFRKKKEREEIQRELQRAKTSILEMKESGANIASAAKILKKAITHLKEGRHEEARTEVIKARKHASMLAKKYKEARRIIGQLYARIQKMKEHGMNTFEFAVLLAKAKKRMDETIEEKGLVMPNYGGAQRIASRAYKAALDKMREHESASNAIFVAEMILEDTMKSMAYVDEDTLRKKVFAEVTRSLKEADNSIKKGELIEAYDTSVEAEKRVETLKRSYKEAVEAYKTAEKSLVEGKEKGIRSSELVKLHEAAGQALVDGNFESARLKSIEVSGEVRSLDDRKRRAKETIEKAENAVEAAKNTGFSVSESQDLLEDARWAFERGIFQRAINCGEDALKKATKISSIHLKVSQNLVKTKKKMNILRELGVEISNELDDVIENAEKNLLLGDYVNSNEELMIARVIIGSLERKHHDLIPEVEERLETA
jgi:tetratricopeptide (TPR) repeat protein